MKKLILAILALIVLLPAQKANAQQNELTREDINTMYDQGRFYELYHISHMPQAFAYTDVDQLYMWALTSSMFNNYAESITAVITLYNEYYDQLDSDTSTRLFYQVFNALMALEEYQEASDWITNNISESNTNESNLALCNEALEYSNFMTTIPKMEATLPQKDITLPIEFISYEDGELITLEVTVDNQAERFVFDTQASENLVDEKFAQRHNLTIIKEEIPVTGIGAETISCKWAIGKELNIGGVVIKNPTFVITPEPLDPGLILGQKVIAQLKEIHIKPSESVIFVPQQSQITSVGLENLMFYGDEYYVCFSSEVSAGMTLNTACTKTTLNHNFFRQHKDYFEANITPITIETGSFKNKKDTQVYPIENIDISINQKEYQLRDILVDGNESEEFVIDFCLGELCVDFIKQFKVVSINFEKMLFDVEM
ncbi:MAG: retropepsin-like aspartic protease [Rikenellaceae bacterium]